MLKKYCIDVEVISTFRRIVLANSEKEAREKARLVGYANARPDDKVSTHLLWEETE